MENLSQRLEKIAQNIEVDNGALRQIPSSYDLAEAFHWSQNGTRLEQVVKGLPAPATRAFVGHEPSIIFLSSPDELVEDLLSPAASLAYHSDIHWGVVADYQHLVVFNSHWILHDNWFTLPALQWSEITLNRELIQALTPSGLMKGVIDEIAVKDREPEHSILGVDDALVQHLDNWRDKALRHVGDAENVDIDLQNAFAQLFILRCVEDRGLAPSIPSLATIVKNDSEIDIDLLKNIFDQAQKQIQSELFNDITLLRFPEFILAGIVNDLYFPTHLPGENIRYDFSWIQTDVLGRAYEKYLSTILVPANVKDPQLRLWRQPKRESSRITVQKQSGVYYTPSYLVRYITERTLEEWWRHTASDEETIPRLVDFSCGSGSFLIAAVDSILRKARSEREKSIWARQMVSKKKVIGIDNDHRAVLLARLALWLKFTEVPDPLPLPKLEEIVICADSLSNEVWEKVPESYDVILGNPPFIATGKIDRAESLRKRFEVAKGRFDYSYLFLELAIKHMDDGGSLGMIVPNRLYINRNAQSIRELITSSLNVSSIINFGGAEVFAGTQAYIGVLIANKQKNNNVEKNPVRVVRIKELPSRSTTAQLYEADTLQEHHSSKYLLAYNSTIPRGSSPWLLLSNEARRARVQLEENGVELASVAGIYQGIKTGANDIFIFEILEESNSSLIQVENGLGDKLLLERKLIRPAIYGSDIKRYQIASSALAILYPYIDGKLIPDLVLREEYPRIHNYLLENRNILSSRSSIKTSKLQWYDLVRKRDESWLESPKLLVRDLAIRTAFAPDQYGKYRIVGGTAIVPADDVQIMPLLAYLNSSIADWYLKASTPDFGSGFQKFEPQHLSKLPIPVSIFDDDKINKNLHVLASQAVRATQEGDFSAIREIEAEIDSFLETVTGIKLSEIS